MVRKKDLKYSKEDKYKLSQKPPPKTQSLNRNM